MITKLQFVCWWSVAHHRTTHHIINSAHTTNLISVGRLQIPRFLRKNLTHFWYFDGKIAFSTWFQEKKCKKLPWNQQWSFHSNEMKMIIGICVGMQKERLRSEWILIENSTLCKEGCNDTSYTWGKLNIYWNVYGTLDQAEINLSTFLVSDMNTYSNPQQFHLIVLFWFCFFSSL